MVVWCKTCCRCTAWTACRLKVASVRSMERVAWVPLWCSVACVHSAHPAHFATRCRAVCVSSELRALQGIDAGKWNEVAQMQVAQRVLALVSRLDANQRTRPEASTESFDAATFTVDILESFPQPCFNTQVSPLPSHFFFYHKCVSAGISSKFGFFFLFFFFIFCSTHEFFWKTSTRNLEGLRRLGEV